MTSSNSSSSFASASGMSGISRGMGGMSVGSPASSTYSNGSASSGGNWIREGQVSIKEDGLKSIFFSKRHAILRESALTFHKSKEVREGSVQGRTASASRRKQAGRRGSPLKW